ncbi:uncharacterized protein ACA1_115750 [Acanthamoeba castellanii str. Neff]|uniref:Pseudouridine synthase n=1 Tax=Acanthamoeba castellanii (strain ATCC 30010 / Neff) TaxID=1257118 RepID=L8H4Q1_ACACF|nr:uncharacterized protein ACA1_115750 [Acanthamoeba castellanii str. Neff]ELR20135.1 hypothetical protein ACA1_115750 [Acanthamoeba castellanii str. Neff]
MKKSISVVRSLNPTPYATPPPVVTPAPAADASTPAVTKPARRVNTASSLFLVQIRTGRFHQVRRHCRFLSHPIIGDSTHGDLPVNHHWQSTTPQGYPRLGLHCFAIDIPLPTPERIAAYLQWWADKEKARAARRAEYGESWRERKLTPEEEVARLEDMGSRRAVGGAEGEEEADDVDKMDPELKEREEELEAILGLNHTTERLRALCPVPDDLRSVWERQEWWADAVTRLPSLGWTQEEIEVRARENDLYGAGWPIPREMPERFIVEDGHSKKTGTLTS